MLNDRDGADSMNLDLLSHPFEDSADADRSAPSELLQGWLEDRSGGSSADDSLASGSRGSHDSSSLFDQIARQHSHLSLNESILPPQGEAALLRTMGSHQRPSRLTGTAPAALALPDVNDEVYGFKLRHQLGSGAFARVFLAKQQNLAGREVVLKISAIEGTEPQTLAQLQHTHVVPIYSVHEDEQTGVRAVCMPYLGGAALSEVLRDVWGRGVPATGRQFIASLDRVSGPAPEFRAGRKPRAGAPNGILQTDTTSPAIARTALDGMSYLHACVWLVCRLSEGLQHAHDRSVLHRDIKPSNILISAEGQPLLLDFNVSQISASGVESVGGTLAYMAPEHLRAVAKRDAASAAKVDERSDLFALGLVLFEMLTGENPNVPAARLTGDVDQLEAMLREGSVPPSLKQSCPFPVPWSLESIVRKCLARNPLDRYASVAQLTEDLSRFLSDRPLRFAPELSTSERMRKWCRRHPRLTSAGYVGLVAVLLFIPGLLALHFTLKHLGVTQGALTAAQSEERIRNFHMGTQGALCLMKTVIPNEEKQRSGIAASEANLNLYGVLASNQWQASAEWQMVNEQERRSLAEEVRELLMVMASTKVRLSGDTEVPGAMALLEKAERIEGLPPLRALAMERARYLDLSHRPKEAEHWRIVAESIRAETAHDLYMLGSAYTRLQTPAGYREGVRLLSEATQLSPRHYWSYFERALCNQELGETVLATSDLGTCIGLWNESPWAYFNRGWLLEKQGKKSAAVADYTDAIRHAPEFISPWFNRGLIRLELRQYSAALADFDKAKSLGRQDPVVDAGRAMALEGLERHAEADLLFTEVLDRSRHPADVTGAQIRWTYAFAVAHRAPLISRRVFDEILEKSPHHPQAWYGQGMLSMKEGELREAIVCFDNALQAEPEFVQARRYRAIAFARLGQIPQAVTDINTCLGRNPNDADSQYVAACVQALAAQAYRTNEAYARVARTEALNFLSQAIALGQPASRATADPDLASIADDPRFLQLTGAKE